MCYFIGLQKQAVSCSIPSWSLCLIEPLTSRCTSRYCCPLPLPLFVCPQPLAVAFNPTNDRLLGRSDRGGGLLLPDPIANCTDPDMTILSGGQRVTKRPGWHQARSACSHHATNCFPETPATPKEVLIKGEQLMSYSLLLLFKQKSIGWPLCQPPSPAY